MQVTIISIQPWDIAKEPDIDNLFISKLRH